MKIKVFFFYALLMIAISACSTPATQPAVLTPTVTKTPTPSQTSSPTPTITPSPTPTVTPTPELPVSLGTSFPFPVETIGPDNCNKVVKLASWGGGDPDVLFSPDGRYFLLGKISGYTLYETSSMKPVFLKNVEFHNFSFSLDGRILVFGNNPNINILDLSTGEIRTIKINGWKITLSPDGQQIVSSDRDNIYFTEISSGKELKVLSIPLSSGTIFYGTGLPAFSQDGKMLAFQLTYGKAIVVYDFEIGGFIGTFFSSHNNETLEFSEDGKSLVTKGYLPGNIDSIEIWNIPSAYRLLSYKTNEHIVSFFTGEGRVTIGLRSAEIIQWNMDTGEKISDVSWGDRFPIFSSQNSSPNGELIAIGLETGVISVWAVDSNRWVIDLNGFQGKVTKLIFSPDGKLIAASSSDGVFKMWEISSGNEKLSLSGFIEIGSYFLISQDGEKIATAGSGKNSTNHGLFLWDVKSGQLLKTLDQEGASYFDFSPDGQLLATHNLNDDFIKIWDVNNGELIKILEARGSMVFSPDGRILATNEFGGKIELWDVANWDSLGSLGYGVGDNPKFSPDGELIVAKYGGSKRIDIFKKTGERVIIWDGEISFDISPDSKLLAVGGKDINIFETETGQLVKKILIEGRGNNADNIIKFSLDNKYILSFSNPYSILNIFDVTTGEVLCSQAIPALTWQPYFTKFSFDNRLLITTGEIWDKFPITFFGIAP